MTSNEAGWMINRGQRWGCVHYFGKWLAHNIKISSPLYFGIYTILDFLVDAWEMLSYQNPAKIYILDGQSPFTFPSTLIFTW